MDWTTAVKTLAGQTDGNRDAAIITVADAISYENQECRDWVAEGRWTGNETEALIAAEWAEYLHPTPARFNPETDLQMIHNRRLREISEQLDALKQSGVSLAEYRATANRLYAELG